jgi:hypothetical protein
MAETYHCRPSQILGLGNPVTAYAVDRGVWVMVNSIQTDQETAVGRLPKNAKESTKDHIRKHVLMTYLGIEPEVSGQFREPPRKG